MTVENSPQGPEQLIDGLNKPELLVILEQYRERELNKAKICETQERRSKSDVAMIMLSQIRMDSAKHTHILQILIDALEEGPPVYFWEYWINRFIGHRVTERELKKHLEIEQEMIQGYKTIIQKTNSPDIQLIFWYLIENEKKHQQILIDACNRLFNLGPPP